MKHYWEKTGKQKYSTTGSVSIEYKCRQCGRNLWTPRRTGKLRSSAWKKSGIEDCKIEIVKAVQDD